MSRPVTSATASCASVLGLILACSSTDVPHLDKDDAAASGGYGVESGGAAGAAGNAGEGGPGGGGTGPGTGGAVPATGGTNTGGRSQPSSGGSSGAGGSTLPDASAPEGGVGSDAGALDSGAPAGCTYTVSPTSDSFAAGASSGTSV